MTILRQLWRRLLQIHPGRQQAAAVGEAGARAPGSLVVQTGRRANSGSRSLWPQADRMASFLQVSTAFWVPVTRRKGKVGRSEV